MSAIKKLGLHKLNFVPDHLYSEAQNQTEKTFGFKWQQRNSYDTTEMQSNARSWLIERYLDNEPTNLNHILGQEPKIILDVGCGSGFSSLLFFAQELKNHHYLGVDISADALEIAKLRFSEAGLPGEFLRGNLLQLPIPDHSIDIIFSEGVLHHTDNTEQALKFLAAKLKPGGKFLFYVYRKKAVIREFTDDHIRQQLKNLTDEEAWKALEALTQLGIALGELNTELTVLEDIPFLGIKKGKMDLQRFFYWNICKLFYKSEYSLAEMNHINFDWFRPLNCHRHTEEEIAKWCAEARLKIDHQNVQESGITIVATKLLTEAIQ